MKLHHANIILGKEGRNFVNAILETDLNFKILGNPDFFVLEMETFGIDDARELSRWVIGKPLAGDTKVALIVTSSITHEAQNALLKVLEEPPSGTHIFINLSSIAGLLPTFMSRVFVLSSENDKTAISKKDSDNFLRSSIKERLATIRLLIKKEDKAGIKDFLVGLEQSLHSKEKAVNPTEELKSVIKAKVFASARGSSPKMILEWLSTVV